MTTMAFLDIEIDGNAISGYNTKQAVGGVDVSGFIELMAFAVGMDREVSASGRVTGHPQFRRLTLSKRLCQASPHFLQALDRNSVVEASVRVFGPDPRTGGDTELFKIKVSEGRITSVDWDGAAGVPATEVIEIAYTSLEGEDLQNGATAIVTARDS